MVKANYNYSFEKTYVNSRKKLEYILNIQGKKERYEILGINDFSSYRNRLSIVVRHLGKTRDGSNSTKENYAQLITRGFPFYFIFKNFYFSLILF